MNKSSRHSNCLILLLLLLNGVMSSAYAAIGEITTVLGSGAAGYNGDNYWGNEGYAQLQLNKPSYVLAYQNGIYVVDTFNQRVRRTNLTPYNQTETVAGEIYVQNIRKGFYGDGGPATQALLNNPWAVALDKQGNLYIADADNHRIRKVDTGGTITTIAGNGTQGSAGDGGAAVNAELNYPDGVAIDGFGNLYIADVGSNTIRKVDITGTISKVAGTTGQAGFSGDGGRAIEAKLNAPKRVTVTRTGIIYVVDKGNDRIRKIDINGIITTVVGNGKGYGGDGGSATGALLNSPSDVAIDSSGNLFIADTENHRIRKVDAATNNISTIAGSLKGYGGDNGPATLAQLNYPDSVAVDRYGDLYIADTDNHRVRKIEGAASPSASGGVSVGKTSTTDDNLWMKVMIQTEERRQIEAIWKQGGDSMTSQGDRVIWGYFYADPQDVSWGYEQNPDLFVKIWYDHSGRIDVNFFHVSVPDIEVYSAIREISKLSYNRSTMNKRYVRHTYKPSENVSEAEVADTVESAVLSVKDNPARNPLPFYNLGVGTLIQTVEKGAISGVFKLGGSGNTTAGDQVAWGFFYASPTDVNWGSSDNPDAYVKVWVDHSGRIDVNFFHVSVPDIKVSSGHDRYEKQGLITMSQRYTRHEYKK
jgi:sugar lactone lactonase YvrE